MRKGRMLGVMLAALAVGLPAPAAAVSEVVIESTSGGFQPKVTKPVLGEHVLWRNDDDLTHTTTGRSPLRLWDRTLAPGAEESRAFRQAGTFPYFCEIHTTMTGKVRVAMQSSPGTAGVGTEVTLRVATDTAPDGFRYRIQRRPEGGTWSAWRTIGGKTTIWRPKASQIGAWQFRTRTERVSNGARSGWSPVIEVNVLEPN